MDIGDLKLFGKKQILIMIHQLKMKRKTAGTKISSQVSLHAS